ncbi:MAG: hypothetical protein ACRD6W_08820 [Nitrososphaerales archaeon]
MATTKSSGATGTSSSSSTAKPKKPTVPAAERITSQLKRAAVTGKVSKEELEKIAALANALITFVS